MFNIFGNSENDREAKILFGSTEESREEMVERKSPYDGKVVSRVPVCGEEDAKRALEIAQKASKASAIAPLHQRIAWLRDVASNLREHQEDFARLIVDEVAKPIHFARIEVQRCAETLELTAGELLDFGGETINTDAMPSGRKTMAYYRRKPVGVAVCITPFNFPLNLIAHKLGPALGTGNAVVLKPTPEAPLTAYKLARLFIDSEYAVPDALSVVYGDADVGSALVRSPIPRVISFTGSVQVGRIISSSAGIKKLALELGGNAATYIDADADVKSAAVRCAFGSFYNSGQVCISLQRIYVHEDIYEEFAEAMAEETSKLKTGSPYEDDTFMGPLINEDAIHRAKSWVASAKDEGATVAVGGEVKDGIFPPTVMTDVTDEMKIVCEEVFAPIVSLVSVPDMQTALEKMNDSPYGLQYSIFTDSLSQAREFIDGAEAGGVLVNEIPTTRFDIQPYGGVKNSGIGREGPRYALEEFTEIQSVVFF
jgi:acyl-CoA reductase-like NAD-dependent aldehyde dehydrogenase